MSGEFAGTLTERILIERPVPSRNAMGLKQYGWEEVARCLASVTLDSVGAEREAMALSAMPKYRVVVRRRDGLAIDHRVTWKGRAMMVRQLLEDPRAKDRLTLRCEEVRP